MRRFVGVVLVLQLLSICTLAGAQIYPRGPMPIGPLKETIIRADVVGVQRSILPYCRLTLNVTYSSNGDVLGNKGFLREVADSLQLHGMDFGFVEFGKQQGDAALARLMGGAVVRVHSITDTEMTQLTPPEAVDRFVKAARERAKDERGITAPEATFSSCFGSPFLPLPPLVYARLLGEKLSLNGTRVFLINTGWSGGPYGVGKRMSLPYTRAIVTAAIEGALDKVGYELDPVFNVYVPASCPGVPEQILRPRQTWADKAAYDETAKKLAGLFRKNFEKYNNMPKEVVEAGPQG
jgi:hypothetical protein